MLVFCMAASKWFDNDHLILGLWYHALIDLHTASLFTNKTHKVRSGTGPKLNMGMTMKCSDIYIIFKTNSTATCKRFCFWVGLDTRGIFVVPGVGLTQRWIVHLSLDDAISKLFRHELFHQLWAGHPNPRPVFSRGWSLGQFLVKGTALPVSLAFRPGFLEHRQFLTALTRPGIKLTHVWDKWIVCKVRWMVCKILVSPVCYMLLIIPNHNLY